MVLAASGCTFAVPLFVCVVTVPRLRRRIGIGFLCRCPRLALFLVFCFSSTLQHISPRVVATSLGVATRCHHKGSPHVVTTRGRHTLSPHVVVTTQKEQQRKKRAFGGKDVAAGGATLMDTLGVGWS